jgi:hypothetical protein
MRCQAPLIGRARYVALLFAVGLIVSSFGPSTTVKAWQAAKPADSPETARIKKVLGARFDLVIEPQGFQEAMFAIATHYKIRIRIDQKTLANSGIDVSSEVKADKSNKPLREVLRSLSDQLQKPVSFQIRDGELLVTPARGKEKPAAN